MEHLVQEFGAWLKQGFGWLVDVIVFGCLWGIRQISRLFGTQFGDASILRIVVFILVLLILLFACYWLFSRFIGVIRWALDQVRICVGSNPVERNNCLGSLRQRRPRCGCGDLGHEEYQLGSAVIY